MSGFPNVGLTVPLLVVYIKNNRISNNVLLIVVYTVVINIVFGFTIFFLIQLLSYSLLLLFTIRILNITILYIGVSFLMMLTYYPWGVFVYDIPLSVYAVNDAPYTIIFVVNNTLVFLWIEPYLNKVFLMMKERYNV